MPLLLSAAGSLLASCVLSGAVALVLVVVLLLHTLTA